MARVKLKGSGVAAMLKEAWIYGVLEPKAQTAMSSAQSSAPVDSGAYRDSLHLERDVTDRARIRLIADVEHAMLVEANTGNLRRSL